jgi:HTH-type transcriptional regulator / antitoxin HipB
MKKMKAQQLQPTFQQNLKAIREARGLTQTELAKRAKSTQNTISELEKGKSSPTLTMIERLCEALDVDSDVLLTTDAVDIFLSASA